ncbi:hypothetical protein [Mycolicibacterium sphagni]|uniref:Uncharacterized protein n=1 Tax=Mycolicibacterium sphagni TaxID=1786 RepID=A0A255D4E1_9MYCO|nr:hypothetical protein [Mycolicibacterium sphagni]OYN74139.1 hypothetical protein CG716_29405 [Mycolicibacterium sphagni]
MDSVTGTRHQQAKIEAWRYLLGDFVDFTSTSWHRGNIWALHIALSKLHVEVYSIGPIELDTAEQIHRRVCCTIR